MNSPSINTKIISHRPLLGSLHNNERYFEMSNNLASVTIFLETSSSYTTAIVWNIFPCFSLNIYELCTCGTRTSLCSSIPYIFILYHSSGTSRTMISCQEDPLAVASQHPLLNLVMLCVSKASIHLALGCVLFFSDSNTRRQWLAKWIWGCYFSQQIFNDLSVHHKWSSDPLQF